MIPQHSSFSPSPSFPSHFLPLLNYSSSGDHGQNGLGSSAMTSLKPSFGSSPFTHQQPLSSSLCFLCDSMGFPSTASSSFCSSLPSPGSDYLSSMSCFVPQLFLPPSQNWRSTMPSMTGSSSIPATLPSSMTFSPYVHPSYSNDVMSILPLDKSLAPNLIKLSSSSSPYFLSPPPCSTALNVAADSHSTDPSIGMDSPKGLSGSSSRQLIKQNSGLPWATMLTDQECLSVECLLDNNNHCLYHNNAGQLPYIHVSPPFEPNHFQKALLPSGDISSSSSAASPSSLGSTFSHQQFDGEVSTVVSSQSSAPSPASTAATPSPSSSTRPSLRSDRYCLDQSESIVSDFSVSRIKEDPTLKEEQEVNVHSVNICPDDIADTSDLTVTVTSSSMQDCAHVPSWPIATSPSLYGLHLPPPTDRLPGMLSAPGIEQNYLGVGSDKVPLSLYGNGCQDMMLASSRAADNDALTAPTAVPSKSDCTPKTGTTTTTPTAAATTGSTKLCGTVRSKSLKAQPKSNLWRAVYDCPWPGCPKSFTQLYHLKIHQRIHTGDRLITCTWKDCGKLFTRKPDLEKHMRIHTGHKPYICTLCGWSFTQSNNAYSHVMNKHKRHRLQYSYDRNWHKEYVKKLTT
eukprot:GHVS01071563.1.p1 GENE.GHVS01071563.1~~GHVS01071563.1.p1  ORF type:complete len:626 (-),score=81.69 GHVS01071563.1:585-2462(-)